MTMAHDNSPGESGGSICIFHCHLGGVHSPILVGVVGVGIAVAGNGSGIGSGSGSRSSRDREWQFVLKWDLVGCLIGVQNGAWVF